MENKKYNKNYGIRTPHPHVGPRLGVAVPTRQPPPHNAAKFFKDKKDNQDNSIYFLPIIKL